MFDVKAFVTNLINNLPECIVSNEMLFNPFSEENLTFLIPKTTKEKFQKVIHLINKKHGIAYLINSQLLISIIADFNES